MLPPVSAKRTAPPAPPGLLLDGVHYQAVYTHDIDGPAPGLRAFVRATRDGETHERWRTLVYEIHYERQRETDVQDVFITSIEPGGHVLLIRDEAGRRFVLDVTTREVWPGGA